MIIPKISLPVLPGSIISAASAAANKAKAAVENAVPNFDDMLASAKSGSLFKDVSAQLSSIGSIGIDTSAIAAQVKAAQENATVDIAIAQAGLEQATRQATAKGIPVTQAQINAALAPLGVLNGFQSSITSALNSAHAAVSTHASAFGASLAGLSPSAAISAITEKAAAFSASIPVAPVSPTAPLASVTVSGVSLPNPNYASQLATFTAGPAAAFATASGAFDSAIGSFTAIAGNTAKIDALASIKSSADSLGASMTNNFSNLTSAAADGKADILNNLKADAMLTMLSKPLPAGLESSLDLSKIDKYAIIKAQETTITQVVITQQPAPDPIRPGSVSILTDVSDPTPLGVNNNKRIWTYELKGLKADQTAAQSAYFSAFGTTATASKEERQAAFNVWFKAISAKVNGPQTEDIRLSSRAVQDSKPDPTTWTAEESNAVTTSKSNTARAKLDPEVVRVSVTLQNEMTKLNSWYEELYNNWIGSDNRFSLQEPLLEKISKYKL